MAYKFKVGDKASYRGNQGTVVEVDKGHILTYRVEWDSSTSHDYNWFEGRELDKVTPSPVKVVPTAPFVPKYKVGDKVIVNSSNKHGTKIQKGTKAVIESLLNSKTPIEAITSDSQMIYSIKIDESGVKWYMPECFLDPDKTKYVPKVGDTCRITRDRPYCADLKEGDIVVIKRIEREGGNIHVNKVDSDVNWFIDMCVMEPVKKETITTKIEKTMTTIHEQILAELKLEVGDIVEITHKVPTRNLGWRNSWAPEMDNAIGKQGIVQRLVSNDGVIVKIDGIETEMDYYYPAQSIKFISKGPKFKEMKISKDYTAKVYADRIEVGCQTITMANFEKLQKLVAEIKK